MPPIDEFEFFLEKPWSDGFPVVTPTEKRVQWMLARPDALAETQLSAWTLGARNGTKHVSDLVLDLAWAAQTKSQPTEH